jgi:streptogramin lyase
VVGSDARDVDVAADCVTGFPENAIARLRPSSGEIDSASAPRKPYGISARADGVWGACHGAQSVVRLDPWSLRVRHEVQVGVSPIAVDAGPSAVWVTVGGEDAVVRIDRGRRRGP